MDVFLEMVLANSPDKIRNGGILQAMVSPMNLVKVGKFLRS